MPTTSNFGWTTPADTDLVKDGAAAIRTLGNGIDTSFLDLKGGTTGQVLSKASNTDLDFSWVAVDPLTILDAKGDLISATAADTPARLAVGTNGQVLTADSTTSTGLKWATPSSPSFVGWYLYNSAVQSLANSTVTDITMDSEFYDTNGFHTGSSATVTIPSGQGGKYLIIGCVTYAANSGGVRYALIDINGSGATNPQVVVPPTSTGIVSVLIANVWDLAAGDTVKLEGNQTSGGNLNVVVQNKDITYFSGAKIG